MSAIYGAIALNGSFALGTAGDAAKLGQRIHNEYRNCRIDRYDIKSRPDAVMGCEIQYYTMEAPNEVLPIIDEENHIMFTADCVLDYRGELIEKLTEAGVTGLYSGTPDGTLIYKAYLTWGKECMEHLRGMFSFVVYDWESGQVHLQTDHFSSRCLFYQVRDGVLYFSTLFFPLIRGTGLEYEENERWLVDTISLRSPAIIVEPEETAVLGVNKVISGQYVVISRGTGSEPLVEKVTYWNPKSKIPTNENMTEVECERQLREIMAESVAQTIRTSGEVAILLSAGLDSSTVACLAAPMLKAQGKKLYSYTSVPLKEAGLSEKGYRMNDETKGVLKICEAYPNIVPTFMDCPGKNILTEADAIVEEWELPCKSEQNAVWLREIKKAAAARGCRILLSGATGNCTISAGSLGNYVTSLVSKGHFYRAYKDIGTYMHKHGGNRKQYIKNYAKAHLKYYKWYFDKEAKDAYRYTITRKDTGERYNVQKRFEKDLLNFKPTKTLDAMRDEIYILDANAQIGEIETANSLYRGLLERDPMRNVKFIEFCMSLPLICFNNKEYDRRLIRQFMHDIVPDEIRLDVQHRGRQSADNEYRIAQVWDEYLPTLQEYLRDEAVGKYFDSTLVQQYFDRLDKNRFVEQFFDMRMIVDAYIFTIFMKKLRN